MKNNIIDARGMRCPWPVLKLARALLDGARPVTIIADDPIAPSEIATFAQERGLTLTVIDTPLGAGFVLN